MGSWGTKVWQNDTAADWFRVFGKSIDIDMIEKTVNDFDLYDGGSIERNRAAAYVLGYIGRTYIWPDSDFEKRDAILDKIVENLYSIRNNEDYIKSWFKEAHREEIKKSLELQIDTLLEIGTVELREKYEHINTEQTMTLKQI